MFSSQINLETDKIYIKSPNYRKIHYRSTSLSCPAHEERLLCAVAANVLLRDSVGSTGASSSSLSLASSSRQEHIMKSFFPIPFDNCGEQISCSMGRVGHFLSLYLIPGCNQSARLHSVNCNARTTCINTDLPTPGKGKSGDP